MTSENLRQFRAIDRLQNREARNRQVLQTRVDVNDKKFKLARDLEVQSRMRQRQATLDAVERSFLSKPFNSLKLRDPKVTNEAITGAQDRLMDLAEQGVELQEELRENRKLIEQNRKEFDEDADAPMNRFQRLGTFRAKVKDLRVLVDKLGGNAASADDMAAVKQMQGILKDYESMFPDNLYYERRTTPGEEEANRQVGIAARLMVMTLAGAYTAYAALAGWKTGNWLPALGGAGVVAASIFGPKRLLEGVDEKTMRETEFLTTKEYEDFFAQTGVRGPEWKKVMNEIREHASDLYPILDEKDPERRIKMLQAKTKELGLSKETIAKITPLVRDGNNFGRFLRVCTIRDDDTQDIAYRYVENGAPKQAFAIAKKSKQMARKTM